MEKEEHEKVALHIKLCKEHALWAKEKHKLSEQELVNSMVYGFTGFMASYIDPNCYTATLDKINKEATRLRLFLEEKDAKGILH